MGMHTRVPVCIQAPGVPGYRKVFSVSWWGPTVSPTVPGTWFAYAPSLKCRTLVWSPACISTYFNFHYWSVSPVSQQTVPRYPLTAPRARTREHPAVSMSYGRTNWIVDNPMGRSDFGVPGTRGKLVSVLCRCHTRVQCTPDHGGISPV